MRLHALLPALLLTFTAATATAQTEWGPSVGSTMPADLAATSHSGKAVSLSALGDGGNGVVIAFVRSADWCPFCKRQLIELSQRAGDFQKRDYTLVSVSYDSVETLRSFHDQFEIEFDLLSDPDSVIIDAFGIRNEDQKPGSAGDGIPHPGIMVFDVDGHLVAKFAEKSYRKRPQVDDVLFAIDARNP